MKTSVDIAGVTLKNPVMTASGTFGSGKEYSEFFDLSCLGAVVTKGVSNVPWPGNPVPRVAETPSGMLNAIGLQNPGVEVFISEDLPFLSEQDARRISQMLEYTRFGLMQELLEKKDENEVPMHEQYAERLNEYLQALRKMNI